MRRPIRVALWIVGFLLLAGLAAIGAMFLYYRPTFEWTK
jgi:hypothetical protein